MDEIMNFESLAPGNVVPIRPDFTPPVQRVFRPSGEAKDISPFNGPLSGPMWLRAHQIPSRYEDTFDYGMYDRLYARFGTEQPRGGVVFKSGLKYTEAEDCKSCFYRFEIDTYGRGCVHNCAYCYAKADLHRHKYWNEPMPFPIDIANLRKTFATVFESDRKHNLRHVLEKRVPLRIGSMSDSFMWMDKKYKVTQELLKLLSFYDYPYLVFTRSDLVADDEYMRLMRTDLAHVQMSISSINEELTRTIEPGAPSPMKRLAALKKLAENDFWTTVRINPLIPIYPDGYFSDPRYDHSKPSKPFPFFSWDMIEVIAQHKVPSLLTGVVRLYPHNFRFLNQALGYDLRSHFSTDAKQTRQALHFSNSETAYYYTRIRDLCHKAGVRFSVCYIGTDGDGSSFERNRPLWDNKKDCCDSKGNVPSFKSSCADIPRSTAKSEEKNDGKGCE